VQCINHKQNNYSYLKQIPNSKIKQQTSLPNQASFSSSFTLLA
jgi:hypothetical protein